MPAAKSEHMNNRRYYLVEDHVDGADYQDGTVIAITPEACYRLNKAGIPYSIIEDHYDTEGLKAGEDGYFYEQLEWLKKIDRLIKENIACCREHCINLARAHFYNMKFFMDSVIIQARIFQEVLNNLKPDAIIYVCANKSGGLEHNIYDLFNNKKPLFPELCRLACKKYGVPVSVRHGVIKEGNVSPWPAIAGKIKKLLKSMHCKSAYYFFKYNKISKFAKRDGQKNRLNLLVLHAGWLGIDMIVKDSIALGYKVFFRSEDRIVLVSDIFQKNVLDFTDLDKIKSRDIANDCINAFSGIMTNKDVISWVSDKSGLDVSGMITPYLKHYIENICFKDISEFLLLKEFYKNEKIDFVIGRSSSEKDSISTFLAAASSKKRACFQHGIMYDAKESAVTELDLVDYYFPMDGISERFFKGSLRSDYVSECQVLQSPHYLKAIKKRWIGVKRPGNTIMYVPTKVFTGMNVFNVNFYTLPWYYELQKSIIDHFGSIKGKDFIYKYAFGQEWQDNSLLLYIKDKGYGNIHVEKRPLAECLGIAERIIFDYPATGFLEAAVSGIPTMSLWHKTFKIGSEIKGCFKKSIQDFSSIADAIQKISGFIGADGRDFVLDIPLADCDAIDLLWEIKDKKAPNPGKRDSRLIEKISV